MSSISADPSPNPNPENPTSMQPSTSNPQNKPTKSKRKKKKKKKSKKSRNSNKKPNWLELPEDVWFHIMSKIETFNIIENVQKVCMMFRRICKQPSMYKSIDMRASEPNIFMGCTEDMNTMTRFAIDRSAGCLNDIFVEYVDDETLMYIADRSKDLKHLRLGQDVDVTDEGLIKALQKLPELEGLLLICPVTSKTVETIGNTCTSLKSFCLTKIGPQRQIHLCNDYAIAIAKSMPHLRHLQLIGHGINNEGLKAILDGCPLLESLNFYACPLILLSVELFKRCAGIINRSPRPGYPTNDYGRRFYDESRDLVYSSYELDSDDSDFDFIDGIEDYFYDDLIDEYLDYDDYAESAFIIGSPPAEFGFF